MKKKGLPQEGLKIIACITMLLDHIGAIVIYKLFITAAAVGSAIAGDLLQIYECLRLVGRLAFPIYCFLLAEGVCYTRNPKRYAFRLGIAAVLSEIPFDLAFYGGINWQHQNVMVTLLFGFFALKVMERCPGVVLKILVSLPFALLAECLKTDYGADGILAIVLFGINRELPYKRLLQFLGLWFVFSPAHSMMLSWLGGINITVQEWAVLAMIPISLYSGQKRTGSRVVQWGFYLFYPVHLAVLMLIARFL